MGFEEGSVILDSATGTYYAGQFVNGRVVFELTKVKKVRGIYLKAKGFCKVHWTTQESRRENDRTVHYTKNHDSYEEYINLKTYLVGSNNGDLHLNAGKYDYPFSFQLPPSCPSSYESSYAHVRYELRVVADRAFKVDQEIGHPMRVVAPLDLNTQNCNEPVDFEFEQDYCCWCMNSGSSETLVKMPRTGYCAGQVIPLEVSCRNPSSVEVTHIKFAIKKDITYKAVDAPDQKHEHDTLLEVRKGPVPAHTDRSWTVQLTVPDMDFYNLASCSFIDINYTFKVTVEPEGCHSDSDDSCPLVFGTIPLRDTEAGPGGPAQLPHTTVSYPPANSPYPAPVVHQPLSAQQPYPGVASPYPNGPYPGAPYPTPAPQPEITAPYPNTSPYPPQTSPYPPQTSPYPPQTSPYPPQTSPYPPQPSPYPPQPSPYPPANPPYPTTSPYPSANPPYPAASPFASPAPYPGPALSQSPAPFPSMPQPEQTTPLKSENPVTMPLLPPGAVPYPPHASPYATASAPEPGTPDTDLKKPLQENINNSPYNPEFINGVSKN